MKVDLNTSECCGWIDPGMLPLCFSRFIDAMYHVRHVPARHAPLAWSLCTTRQSPCSMPQSPCLAPYKHLYDWPLVHGVWDMARMVHGDSHPFSPTRHCVRRSVTSHEQCTMRTFSAQPALHQWSSSSQPRYDPGCCWAVTHAPINVSERASERVSEWAGADLGIL